MCITWCGKNMNSLYSLACFYAFSVSFLGYFSNIADVSVNFVLNVTLRFTKKNIFILHFLLYL